MKKKNIDLISSANSNSNLGENNEKNKNNDNSINQFLIFYFLKL